MIRNLGLNFSATVKVIIVSVIVVLTIVLGFSLYVYVLNKKVDSLSSKLKTCKVSKEKVKAEAKAEQHELVSRINSLEQSYMEELSKNAKQNAAANRKARGSIVEDKQENKDTIKKAKDEKNFGPIWVRIDSLL